eukprot:jgi/Botrbrau1/357/Bobra.110_2s0015.1
MPSVHNLTVYNAVRMMATRACLCNPSTSCSSFGIYTSLLTTHHGTITVFSDIMAVTSQRFYSSSTSSGTAGSRHYEYFPNCAHMCDDVHIATGAHTCAIMCTHVRPRTGLLVCALHVGCLCAD